MAINDNPEADKLADAELSAESSTEDQPEGLLLPIEGEKGLAPVPSLEETETEPENTFEPGLEDPQEDSASDDEDILKTVEEDDDWVLVDKVRPIKSFKANQTGKQKKNYWWQWWVDTFNACAEVANTGIGIKIVENWFPVLHSLLGGADAIIEANADPLIYFFRFLTRVVRVIGREYFHIVLDEEEKDRAHPHLTRGDIISGAFLMCSVPFFFLSPMLVLVGWGIAMAGMWTMFHYDYVYPAQKAFIDYRNARNEGHSHAEVETAYHDYKTLEVSRNFYFVTLLSVMLLAITHAAIPVAPLIIVPVLTFISTLAGSMAALALVTRLYNQFQHNQYYKGLKKDELKRQKDNDLVQTQEVEEDTLKISAKLQAATMQTQAIDATKPRPLVIPPDTDKWLDATIGTPRGGLNRNHLFQPALKLDLTNVDMDHRYATIPGV